MTSTHLNEPELLSAEELRKMDAYWRACNYMCAGMILPAQQSLAQNASAPRTLQESIARTLGLRSRSDVCMGPPEPRYSEVRPGHDLYFGSGAWGAGGNLQLLSGRNLFGDLSGKEPGRSGFAQAFPCVFVSWPVGESLYTRSSRVDS